MKNRIKELREKNNETQKHISIIFNIHQTTLSKYELGRIDIPNELLKRFSLYFDTSIDYILYLTNDIEPYRRLKNKSSEKAGESK